MMKRPMLVCASCCDPIRRDDGTFAPASDYAVCDYCSALVCHDDECSETDRDGLTRCRMCWERDTLPDLDESGLDPHLVDSLH